MRTNRPSHWPRKPKPMAAPILAAAGKQATQPKLPTIVPITAALSATRVVMDIAPFEGQLPRRNAQLRVKFFRMDRAETCSVSSKVTCDRRWSARARKRMKVDLIQLRGKIADLQNDGSGSVRRVDQI